MPFKSSTPVRATEPSPGCAPAAAEVTVARGPGPRGLGAAIVSSLAFLTACGAPDDAGSLRANDPAGPVDPVEAARLAPSRESGAPAGILAQTDGTPTSDGSLRKVSFGKGDCGSSVTPTGIPPKGQALPNGVIKLSFCVKISVPTGTTFTYDESKWGAWLGTSESPYYVGEEIANITSEATLSGSDSERQGKVTFEIKLPDNVIPAALYDNLDSTGGRQRLKVTPFYSSAGNGPDNSDTSKKIDGLPDIFMQNDVGAIVAPPGIRKVTVSDGAFVVEFREPSSLAAEKPLDAGASEAQGNSNVSGFLVMYWNHDECKARASEPGAWTFQLNPTYDKANGGVVGKRDASNKKVACDYPEQVVPGKAPCAFGCSTVKEQGYYGRALEDVLQPAVIPSKVGNEGREGSGCYTVVRVDTSAKSFGVSGLENGSTYGVSVFALDSSGNVGRGRSECARVTPQDIPLASREKGADLKTSDCFVVTAASGDTGSRAVHAWRVLRDQWINETAAGRAFTAWYLVRGPRLAGWIDSHPALKKPLEEILEFSGEMALGVLEGGRKALREAERAFSRAKETISGLLVPEARAQGFSETELSGAEGTTSIQSTTGTEGTTSTQSTTGAQGTSGGAQSSDFSSPRDEFEHNPRGTPSGALYLLVGVLTPTEDDDLWKGYYAKKRPLSITVGQTFRLLDAGGELGIGGEFNYLGTTGKVPDRTVSTGAPVPAEVRGTRISFYSLGAALALDYRLRVGKAPWLAPRFAVTAGTQRLREEISAPEATGSTTAGQSDVRPRGAEGWSPMLGARASLEISALGAWGSEGGSMRYSYGLEDLALSLYAGYTKDLAKKMLRISGVHVGGGFVFLFL